MSPMSPHGKVQALTEGEIPSIERVLRTSEYTYQRFTPDELELVLQRSPGVGLLNGQSLHGFLLPQLVNPPSAWIGGFGVSWTASTDYAQIFTLLLEQLSTQLTARGVRYLYYSGNDFELDWLRPVLMKQSFLPYCHLYSYDKYEFSIPTEGNQEVVIRPVRIPEDIPALLAIEQACFEDLWRYNPTAFTDIAATHPYFVIAELNEHVVGYQFNALDSGYGYLVRIAVLPTVGGRGIGARLLAEAVRFFERAGVLRIMLNTQDDNWYAHRLYEWFQFMRLPQKGFVLRKPL